jgi:hypothetical protein
VLDTAETLKDLEVPEGRRLLHDFYHDRRLKHLLEFRTLFDCWKMARKGTEILFSDGRRVRFETHLGAKLGTRVFFEEIVSRYYSNFVQGLVYLGGVFVLIGVGLYLAGFPFWIPLATFAVEALFLVALAFITAYTPAVDVLSPQGSMALPETLLASINSTVREMTNAVSDLFRLIAQSDIRQDVLLTRLTEHLSKVTSDNTGQFTGKIDQLTRTVETYMASVRSLQEDMLRRQSELQRLLAALEEREGRGT